MLAPRTLDDALRAYGIVAPKQLNLLAAQLTAAEKTQVCGAKTRQQIQAVLSRVAQRQGMNTKNPKSYVHP